MTSFSTLLRSWFPVLLMTLAPAMLFAQTEGDVFTADGYTCKVLSANAATKSGEAEITGAASEVGESLVIPASVKHTFDGGEWTFAITAIGEKAFAESKELKSVSFPALAETSVTKIGPLAFHHCTALQSINLEDTKIEVLEALFTKDDSDEMYFDDLKKLRLPETLKEIKGYAMQFLGIRSMTIPASVTTIGEGILEGNIYLEEFYWKGAQVTRLPQYTFLGDDALQKVYFLTVNDIEPDGLTDMHFYMCHKEKLTVYVTPGSYEILTANGYDNESSVFSTLAIDSEWTGIQPAWSEKAIESKREDSKDVYTLQGIRVANPVKGRLYISNGRKTIWK